MQHSTCKASVGNPCLRLYIRKKRRSEGLVRPAPVTHLIETGGGSLFLTTAPDRRVAAKAKKKVRSITQFTAKVRRGGSEPRCAVSLVCSRGSMRDVLEKIHSDDHHDRLVDGWE